MMIQKIKCLLWLAGGLGIVALLGCGGGAGRTPLVLYSPHGRDLLSLMEKTYEKLHPAVDVRWLDMGSQEVYDRVRSEGANPQADIWYAGPQQTLAKAADERLR